MLKKILLVLGLLVLAAVGLLALALGPVYWATSPLTAPGDYAEQDDSRVQVPAPRGLEVQPFDPLKNVYWGDVHVHTVESMDAVLFGTTATVEDAYRFAKGETLRSPGGELMQLARPLDFVAITDHAEGFGMRTRCDDDDLAFVESLTCWIMETPNLATFVIVRGGRDAEPTAGAAGATPAGVYQNKKRERRGRTNLPICSPDYGGEERCLRDARTDWQRYIEAADRYNEPGVFTAFSAYEFSPVLDHGGKHHRNVIFNGSELPAQAIASFYVPIAIELWRGLDDRWPGGCDATAVPR